MVNPFCRLRSITNPSALRLNNGAHGRACDARSSLLCSMQAAALRRQLIFGTCFAKRLQSQTVLLNAQECWILREVTMRPPRIGQLRDEA
jgi:hypothetical protein